MGLFWILNRLGCFDELFCTGFVRWRRLKQVWLLVNVREHLLLHRTEHRKLSVDHHLLGEQRVAKVLPKLGLPHEHLHRLQKLAGVGLKRIVLDLHRN
jgi:hypothetical protein